MVRSEGDMSLKNLVTPPGIDPGTVRLVAQSLNHYATPGPYLVEGLWFFTKNSIRRGEKIRKFIFKTTYLARNKKNIAFYPLICLCACIQQLALIYWLLKE